MKEKTVHSDTNLSLNQAISRYLDLAKFLDLLRTNELHLEPAVGFHDPMEGTLPESIRELLLEMPGERRRNKSIEELEYENKLRTNISCWTLGSEDNMALWKIYGGSSNQSVAISTTIEKIVNSAFAWCEEGKVCIKRVQYIDHAGTLPDGVYALDENIFGVKHKAYEFEQEVRVVLTRPIGSPRAALRLPINVNSCITKIILSPEADDWFYDLVIDLVKKYNVNVPVERSRLTSLIYKAKRIKMDWR